MSVELGGPWWAWLLVGIAAYGTFIAITGAAAERAATIVIRRALRDAEEEAGRTQPAYRKEIPPEVEAMTRKIHEDRHAPPPITFEEPMLRPVEDEEDGNGTPTAQ